MFCPSPTVAIGMWDGKASCPVDSGPIALFMAIRWSVLLCDAGALCFDGNEGVFEHGHAGRDNGCKRMQNLLMQLEKCTPEQSLQPLRDALQILLEITLVTTSKDTKPTLYESGQAYSLNSIVLHVLNTALGTANYWIQTSEEVYESTCQNLRRTL